MYGGLSKFVHFRFVNIVLSNNSQVYILLRVIAQANREIEATATASTEADEQTGRRRQAKSGSNCLYTQSGCPSLSF